MLKAIELENFKAFGERCRIEFAPITLIFGENSAGKSSILQSLNLLKQSRDGRDTGAIILPRAESGIVDLGGFKEMVFDHDLDRKISIRVDLAAAESRFKQRTSDEVHDGTAIEIEFDRPADCKEIRLESISFYSSESKAMVASFEPLELTSNERRSFERELLPIRNYRPESGNSIAAAQCRFVSSRPELWQEIFDRTKRRAGKIADELRQLQSESQDSVAQPSLFSDDDNERQSWSNQVDKAIQFYDSDFTISAFIDRMMRAESKTRVALDGFIPVPVRHRETAGLPELETFRRYGPTRLRMRELTLDLMSYTVNRGRQLEELLESCYPLGPFRRPPARLYAFAGKSPNNVGYAGDMLPDLLFRRAEVVEEANQWMDRLEIGYHIKVQPVGEESRDLFEVRLVDRRRNTEVDVALTDVGFGISQILPLIIQSLAGEGQIITVEQPEVHIHPRLQADLGDLLAASIQEPRSHRFIIETHSEHLVLRMQRLIREGKLAPSDVSILYVRRGPVGSQVERLRLDESGEFVDDWPGGFFPERLRELM